MVGVVIHNRKTGEEYVVQESDFDTVEIQDGKTYKDLGYRIVRSENGEPRQTLEQSLKSELDDIETDMKRLEERRVVVAHQLDAIKAEKEAAQQEAKRERSSKSAGAGAAADGDGASGDGTDRASGAGAQ